ncbi:P-loop containing nucleoside triphosphate hydrolase protein [Lentinus tigrinus ALCF2SS1-7]|uniref:P-loop containing nucleoside triphosphate hydrolase protein n=1 Tax=Lentinus tigrinus ALCF2SS1-6 TaxID=1328759 RepID=A0A5C2S5S1_9APHY|nr:P-loop containing nucleoside triphosphate hydrolase protein [Lentinus tigrinus ALCF2SS1-6]RPD73283.1 P-loop containing nucleoside triphosphate hydrolase protein [Lentinus tigrinus ALCF2SS1-7]
MNATVATTASPSEPSNGFASRPAAFSDGPLPLSLPRMVFTLLSASAFWDWARLLLIGALVEGLRRSLSKIWEKLCQSLWVTATFDFDDDAADWLMHWLSKKKVFQTARDIEVSTRGGTIDDLGENDDSDQEAEYNVVFLPSTSQTYSAWYKGHYITISRDRVTTAGSYGHAEDYLQIRMLTRSPALLRELLRDARKAYKVANEHLIEVSVAEDGDRWRRVAMQTKRPPSSVILDPGVLELVLDDARDFLSSKKWYADRGIPFRRGYLLHGAPGAGKTSMIHTIAGELGLSIYILSLTVMGLDDNNLKSLIAHLPKSCIVLMEDVDAAFTRSIKRDIVDPETQSHTHQSRASSPEDTGDSGKETQFGRVTLSGLLNALDGIAAHEGRILFATTNSYGSLDPALLRPGRLDLHIEFHLASTYQVKELFKRFYTCTPSEEGEASSNRSADDSEKTQTGSSSTNATSSASPSRSDASTMPEGISSVYPGSVHTSRVANLSATQAADLADRFAEIIPARTFSMATLQGYLMAYKTRPYAAVEEAAAWVQKKKKEKPTPAAAARMEPNGAATVAEADELPESAT